MARSPVIAMSLGVAGLIPFMGGAGLVLLGPAPAQHWAVLALSAYGAVIASFLGGVRWGAALRDAPENPNATTLIGAVAPSISGWAAVLLVAPPAPSPVAGLLVLLVTFVTLLIWDMRPAARWPIWYRRLRVGLSAGALAALAAGLVALVAP